MIEESSYQTCGQILGKLEVQVSLQLQAKVMLLNGIVAELRLSLSGTC